MLKKATESPFIWILILSNFIVFQFTYFYTHVPVELTYHAADQSVTSQKSPSYAAFGIPEGKAKALPSILISDEESAKIDRKIYGGKNDKAHLGGFTDIDLHGISPAVWKFMIEYFGVKSMLDVGCGRGISTSWFALHGVEALCVEGSHEAVTKSILPSPETQIVEHDFSRGPWWPPRTVDAVWCVEFLEHVGRNFHINYIPAFRKAAFIFVSHSRWGGWHHVEVHDSKWWIAKMQGYGFVYSEDFTTMVRKEAGEERNNEIPAPNGKTYNAQHVWTTMMVFINPAVASLPEHQHLFAESGCYKGKKPGGEIDNRPCNTDLESKLPNEFKPLNLTTDMDTEWEDLVKQNIQQHE